MKKSSLLCLQLHTIVDPASSLEPIYCQLLELRKIPVTTQGTVIVQVGVPIGNNDYVNAAIQQVLGS